MNTSRSWMYARVNDDGCLNLDFVAGLDSFIEYVCSQPEHMDGRKIWCPYFKC